MRVGRYVYLRLTEDEIDTIIFAIKLANRHSDYDELYVALGNEGYSISQADDEEVTHETVIKCLEDVADLRLAVCERADYLRVIRCLAIDEDMPRLMSLIEEATGIPDEDVFDEIAFPDGDEDWTVSRVLYEQFERQKLKLLRLGYPVPQGTQVRPGLNILEADDPAFREPEQMSLPGIPKPDEDA